jgi:hypothetical protein
MKIQDIIFLLVLLLLIYKQNPRWMVISGLISLVISIPLFSFWIFFTAQRLTWYAGGFFLLAIIFYLFIKHEKRNS